MKTSIIIRLLVSLYLGVGLANASTAQVISKQIVIGEELKIYSDTLNEERTILVGKPASYDQEDESYPIMILLDAGTHFHYTTGITRYLARNEFIPELLVIAVENTDRARDLTPPSQVDSDINRLPTHGGAADFQTFIANELLPWIDENYRTRPYRILVGHSLGGLFAINSLVTRPDIFDAYIAISPSLQWNDQGLVNQAESFFDNMQELNVSLFMTAGNEFGKDLLGGVRKFSGVLDEKSPPGFEWHFEHMPLETHSSVPQRSLYQGLEFIFANWFMRNPVEFYRDYGLQALKQFHVIGDVRYGYERGLPSSTVINILAHFAFSGQIDDANDLLIRYRETSQPPSSFYRQLNFLNREAGTNLGQGFPELIPDKD